MLSAAKQKSEDLMFSVKLSWIRFLTWLSAAKAFSRHCCSSVSVFSSCSTFSCFSCLQESRVFRSISTSNWQWSRGRQKAQRRGNRENDKAKRATERVPYICCLQGGLNGSHIVLQRGFAVHERAVLRRQSRSRCRPSPSFSLPCDTWIQQHTCTTHAGNVPFQPHFRVL